MGAARLLFVLRVSAIETNEYAQWSERVMEAVTMSNDREYLYELALILEHAEGEREGIDSDTYFIRIERMTARDIAARLKQIASRLPVLH